MSNSPINDDDNLMAFQAVGKGRTRAYPVSWKALKAAIVALFPAQKDYSPAIQAEAEARSSADLGLGAGIALEGKARGTADQALADAISIEGRARSDADAAGAAALSNAMAAEAKLRSDGDAAGAKALTDAMAAEAKARGDAYTALATRVKTLEDKAVQRIERYIGAVSGSTGVATITWTKAFAAPPLGKVIDGWSGTNGAQQITGRVTGTTTTTATVAVRRSKGTLLLTDGPFEVAPAGTTVEIEVTGF